MENAKYPISRSHFAYIDGANLYRGVLALGWRMDYSRLRVWLREKYKVSVAYLFIGYIARQRVLYRKLQDCGFTLVFKEVVVDSSGKPKGNCDSDLVLRAVRDAYEVPEAGAIIVASDGDYASLVSFLMERGRIVTLLSPSPPERCSILLKRTGVHIAYISDQVNSLRFQSENERAPDGD